MEKIKPLLLTVICFVVGALYSNAQNIIPLDSSNFEIKPENIIEFQGRKCLKGKATLKDTDFTNGIIEFDIWTNGEHSYPGVAFRLQPNETCEEIYIRPHVSGKDLAVQYTPEFLGEACWQLYHGNGYTTKYDIPTNRWFHFKAVIKDNTAKLFLDNSETPVLEMNLVVEITNGQIRFKTTGKQTYFSNIKIEKTPSVQKELLPVLYASENKEWEISKLLKTSVYNADKYPRFFGIFSAGWEKVNSDVNGMVNVSKYRKPERNGKDCIYARKTIYSEKSQSVKMAFGYSDAIKVFANEKLLYSGNYAYKSRGSAFSGNIGLFDTLNVELEKGRNEIFIVLKNNFGGWGFIFNSVEELLSLPKSSVQLQNSWNTNADELFPESVVYDPKRDVLYFSNFDVKASKKNYPSGYISKVSLKGEMINARYIDSINSPSGICLYHDCIYITERDGLSVYSLNKGKLLDKYIYPKEMKFANDVIADDKGNIYITNTDTGNGIDDIYVLKKGKIEPWISSEQLSLLNGILYDNGYLVVGNSGKNLLQKINIETKEIQTITCLGSGIIDGIRKDGNGNYLVSLWDGKLYEITQDGNIELLLNSKYKFNTADFEYIPSKKIFVIPTFLGKNIRCYTRTK
jgi:hypothetical protein